MSPDVQNAQGTPPQAEVTPKVLPYKRFAEILPSPAASLYNLMSATIGSNKVPVAITSLRAWLQGTEYKRLVTKYPQGIAISNVSTRHSKTETVTVNLGDILKICESAESVRNALQADFALIMGKGAETGADSEFEKFLAES